MTITPASLSEDRPRPAKEGSVTRWAITHSGGSYLVWRAL